MTPSLTYEESIKELNIWVLMGKFQDFPNQFHTKKVRSIENYTRLLGEDFYQFFNDSRQHLLFFPFCFVQLYILSSFH